MENKAVLPSVPLARYPNFLSITLCVWLCLCLSQASTSDQSGVGPDGAFVFRGSADDPDEVFVL